MRNPRVWGVENSADEFARVVDGVSTPIVEENPAEELNYRKWMTALRSSVFID